MIIFRRNFWGLLLVVLGALLILRNLLGWDIPIWGIIWPLILILLGLSIIARPSYGVRDDHQVIFDQGSVKYSDKNKEYQAVFARAVFDFRDIKVKESSRIKISTVFGNGILKINRDTPMKIKTTSAFGSAKFPDGSSVAFGDRVYTTKAYDPDKPFISIDASVVFGEFEVIV